MKFNVVIGNPPYNRGMDLDFVKLGFDLCTKYCIMITPAKWQTAADDQRVASKTINYGEFREQLVPHMSKVVFYPDASDVFNIRIYGGISYFILDKINKFNECLVVNKSRLQEKFSNTAKRGIVKGGILNNTGSEVIEYFKEVTKIYGLSTLGRYQVWITDTYDSSSNGLCMFRKEGNTGVLCPSRIIDSTCEVNTVGTAKLLYASDELSECSSFISWLYSKFTRFFILMAVDGFHIGGDMYYYRFVPAPPSGKFDHIYTDEELYKAFNLPQEYIDVIEAVIRERK